jgi:uncharacterized protein
MLVEYMDTVFYLLGKAVVILALLVLVVSVFGALLILYSFKTGHFFAARLMLISISLLESVIKTLFLMARADDSIVDDVGVRLRNYINRKKFLCIPHDRRFVFIPQCVRSVDCPAKLTPEGIKCVGCGQCNVGEAKKFAEGLGYRFFVVSGSSFIRRIIRKYRPEAIIGVGCQLEIKEGLDLCHSHDIPAIGIPLSRAGCVSTTLDWEKLYDEISDRT